jgi:outer membrane protein assembly factor BamB
MRRRNGLPQHLAVLAALLIGLACVADASTHAAWAAGPTAPIRPTARPEPVPPPPPNQASARWTTFGRDMQRTGYNPNENVLSPQTVPGLKPRWAVDVGGPVLTQPLVYNGLVYVANMTGGVFALNATTGAGVWSVQLPAVQTTCDDFAASGGVVGVIATPTIDTTQNRMFVTAGDGTLHALDIATGNELPGYPLQLLAPGFSPALNLVYGSPTLYQSPLGAVQVMYIGTASACDMPPYMGQVVQVLPNTAQVSNRWYTDGTNGVSGGGIWGPGGVSLETDGSAIYAATGNSLGAVDDLPYFDSVVKLSNTLALLAFDSPALAGTDVDFGQHPSSTSLRAVLP